MSMRLLPKPDIMVIKSVCAEFKSGFCYCTSQFYSGHYETAEKAIAAAEWSAKKPNSSGDRNP